MIDLIEQIAQALWFLLPAGFANMAPVFAAHWFPQQIAPLDFGVEVRGTRLLGDHKTIRGAVAGVFLGGLTFCAQRGIASFAENFMVIAYPGFAQLPIWFGFWQGFCAIAGDAGKSFFKRQFGIPPGSSWVPFDQIDWMIGALLGSLVFVPVSFSLALTSLALAAVVSAVARVIGYFFKLNSHYL